jgi:hypothetical protein
VHTPDSSKKSFLSLTDSLSKQLDAIKLFYFLPDDATGIQDDGDKITTYLWMAMSYAESRSVKSARNALDQITHLQSRIDKAILLSKDLEKGLMADWKNQYAKLKPEIFKPNLLD